MFQMSSRFMEMRERVVQYEIHFQCCSQVASRYIFAHTVRDHFVAWIDEEDNCIDEGSKGN